MKLLIVLLGSNPLPVFVTIKAVQQEQELGFDALLFVFSNHTNQYLVYIQAALSTQLKSINKSYCNLEDGQRRPQEIAEKIRASLVRMIPAPTEIHLNHTGGTKTMAIHGFKAASEFAASKGIPLVISDLDPDCHKLNVTKNGQTLMYPSNGTFLESIQCKIEDLTELHGFVTRRPGSETIEDTYAGLQLVDFFDQILSDEHIKIFPEDDFHSKWSNVRNKNPNQLQDYLQRKHKLVGKDSVVEHFSLGTLISIENMLEDDFFMNLHSILEFVDGKWLEYFVFSRIKALIDAREITVDKTLHSHMVQLGSAEANRDCELDVIVMKGYQLALISCTTCDDIGNVKSKAFEAIYRANQLGGEQAKVLIVSMMKAAEPLNRSEYTLKSLEHDLTSFDLNRNVYLAGIQHLQNCEQTPRHQDFTSLDTKLKQLLT